MSASPSIPLAELDPSPLERHYLPALRQRFKAEVNRMTGGGMQRLLADRPDAADLAFLLSYVYAFHWLERTVPGRYRGPVLAPFRTGPRAFLMDLLGHSADASELVRSYITHWQQEAEGPVQKQETERLLTAAGGDPDALTERVLAVWEGLGLFARSEAQAYRDLGREERERYAGMLGEEDRERLALVDARPEPPAEPARFSKLGLIPAMGCPQTCRHCMFIWRPPMRHTPDPAPLLDLVDGLTDSVLLTGGDLTRHLHELTRAIASMPSVSTFAILLNGEFATDRATTERTLEEMAAAVRRRTASWAPAQVLLQISFDEFHQEILADQHGHLRERIPVAKIANIVECAPRFPEIQLCLVHKQTALNFSMDLFRRGVFGRLVEELGRRGHQVQLLTTAPSPRTKRHPLQPDMQGAVVKDASFVLTRWPQRPILLTSSTIDAYGRASLLEEGETVRERDLLEEVLRGETPEGEVFDTDLMFWYNGWATLFSAVHVCLGDLYREGPQTILSRHRKDPLVAALRTFDRRLLGYYAEVRDDLEKRLESATGPHHLFHSLTEDPAVRLHMTRRLLHP